VVNRLLLRHADAVVGDGERLGRRIKAHPDFQLAVVFVKAGVIERLEPQLVAGVRSVGDQLAQKDFGVGVQRVGDQLSSWATSAWKERV